MIDSRDSMAPRALVKELNTGSWAPPGTLAHVHPHMPTGAREERATGAGEGQIVSSGSLFGRGNWRQREWEALEGVIPVPELQQSLELEGNRENRV